MATSNAVYCSFCGESSDIRPLIISSEAGDARICNECITKCVVTLNDYINHVHPHLQPVEKG